MLCSKIVPPLQLPWKDVALDPDGSAIARGIPISIGTPPQQLSLRPVINLNNTFVFQGSVCGNLPNAGCSAPLGGVFDIFKSSSSVFENPPEWNGSSSVTEHLELDGGLDSPYIYFQDSLRISPQETLLGFPIVAYTTLAIGQCSERHQKEELQQLTICKSFPKHAWARSTVLISQRRKP